MTSTPMDKIDELLDSVDSLPPAPQVLVQLLSVLSKAETNLTRVVDLISFDPALTAKLLQTCNSGLFGRSTSVNDVSDAVNRLGFQAVYHIVAVACGERFIRTSPDTGVDAGLMWRHSVTVAFAAQFLSEGMLHDGGLPFTAGMLHDLGKVVMAEAYKAEYGQLVNRAALVGKTLVEQERALFGMDHCEVGARLLERWKFSPRFVASVRYHHDPLSAGDDAAPFASCIDLADALAHSLDDRGEGPAIFVIGSQAALKVLNLTSADLLRYSDRIRENVDFVEAMCAMRS